MTFSNTHPSIVNYMHRLFFVGLSPLWVIQPMLVTAAVVKPATAIDTPPEIITAPVRIDGITLFRVRGVSSFPAPRRAERIVARIEKLAADHNFDPKTIQLSEMEGATVIVATGERIVVVLDDDAQLEHLARQALAQTYRRKSRKRLLPIARSEQSRPCSVMRCTSG